MAYQRGQDHDGLLEGFAKRKPPRELAFPRRLDQAETELATRPHSTANDRRTQSETHATPARDDRNRWPV
jgi:hypothetical protein